MHFVVTCGRCLQAFRTTLFSFAYVTEFTTETRAYPLGVANAAAQKQMHPRKKLRSSGSSGGASDMDPLPDPKDTSELPHKPSGNDNKGRGRGKGKQQQAPVSTEPTADGVCGWMCVWLWALEVDVSSARVLGCVALCDLCALSIGCPFVAAAQSRGGQQAASKARLSHSHGICQQQCRGYACCLCCSCP